MPRRPEAQHRLDLWSIPLLFVTACGRHTHAAADGGAMGSPGGGLPANALAVPLVSQATSYSCGAAALQAVLYYWEAYDGNESALYAALGTTPEKGTEPRSIVKVAKSFGLDAIYRWDVSLDDVRRGYAGGDTVILDLQAWQESKEKRDWASDWDDGHYVVLVAIDDTRVFAMDPSAHYGYASLPIAEFVARWHDYEENDAGRVYIQHMAIFIHGRAHVEAGALVPLE